MAIRAGTVFMRSALAGLCLTLTLVAARVAPAEPATPEAATAGAAPASAAPTHRPLRQNQPPPPLMPTDPEVFKGYPDAPRYRVVARKQLLALYPCSQCHKLLPLNTMPRNLVAAPHPADLRHGQGRFWCLDCHLASDHDDSLHTLAGTKVDYNDSSLVCGQCHGARHRDWAFGGHGKRVAGWQGERQIYACTHCHDPHSPKLLPRQAGKPPQVRSGLEAMKPARAESALTWRRAVPESRHVKAP
jgi:hypothetical protein